jgi:hypothetical protein
MNRFIIRVASHFDLEVFGKFAKGILIPDAKLWKDQYFLETEMSFDEVKQLPFVIEVEMQER